MALIHEQLVKVMQAVTGVAKRDRNEAQRFTFRGIDAVMNAVGPALREHQVIIAPTVENVEYNTVEVGRNRTPMAHVLATVQYMFFAADGSKITSRVVGEAMDSGDKAVSKAMSVALRIALLQTLALPTDEKDPDHDTYERATTHPAASQVTTYPTSPHSPPQATPTTRPTTNAPLPAPTSQPPTAQPLPTPQATSSPAQPTTPAPPSRPTPTGPPKPTPHAPTTQDTPNRASTTSQAEPLPTSRTETGRTGPPDLADQARQAILDWGDANKVAPVQLAQRFNEEMGQDIRDANIEALNSFYAILVLNAKEVTS